MGNMAGTMERRGRRIRYVIDPDRLYELRMLKGWTQTALAKKAGLVKATISLYESGMRRTPNPDTTRRVARALGVKPAEILKREEVPETEEER